MKPLNEYYDSKIKEQESGISTNVIGSGDATTGVLGSTDNTIPTKIFKGVAKRASLSGEVTE